MAFYQIPKELLDDEAYNKLDLPTIVLYSLMLDRAQLSALNSDKFTDDNGRIYIIFTVAEVMRRCRCYERAAVRMVKELENIGLIEKRRQGQGKPTLIYVKYLSTVSTGDGNLSTVSTDFSGSELANRQFKNLQNANSKVGESTIQELSKSQCSNTYRNQTKRNQTDIYKSEQNPKDDKISKKDDRYDYLRRSWEKKK